MEVYTLDSLYRRIAVVDNHISLIWTERVSSIGDFELTLNSTLANRNLFKVGTRLAMNESYRLMVVETVEDSIDSEGRKTLTITGPSFEHILDDRVARGTLGDLTTTPKWSLTGTPAEIMRQIFHDICVTGILDAGDIIAGITEGSDIFPTDTIDEPSDTITVEIDPTTVYQATAELASQYGLGFRLVWDFSTSLLYYDVYSGCDRTTQQNVLPAVVFSPDLDNLQNTTELTSIALFKNVAYVFSPVGHEVVYPLDVDPLIAGFERRVLLVKADDITDPDGPTASALMIQRGLDELAKNRNFQAFDGEISQNSQYKYGIDYNLGDVIEQRNTDGVTNQMQVSEQIFVSDKEGERSYPTLSLYKFITPGSWSGWDANQTWFDLDADPVTWSELP
jgi:hypothetical protein